MEDIPLELIAIIFRYVVSMDQSTEDKKRICDWMCARLTCKRWNTIASDPQLVTPPKSSEYFSYMAQVAEQSERYQEMADWMKKRNELCTDELSVMERNLFSVAYKNVAGSYRASWRITSSVKQKEENRTSDQPKDPNQLRLAELYLSKLQAEMCALFRDIIDQLDRHVLPNNPSAESQVFFLKMKADYLRYMAEVEKDEVQKFCTDEAEKFYRQATVIAEAELKTTHPIRLGLALNFSVFYYEIRQDVVKSSEISKQAFDNAIKDLDTLSEESYKDSTLIMQLMRDGITLWVPTTDDDAEDQQNTNGGQQPKEE